MGKNKPQVTVEELNFNDIVTKLKEQDIYCEINNVSVRIGVTRPAGEGQYSSNRADIEVAATVAIDTTDGKAKDKFETVVNALVALTGVKTKGTAKALQ